jgi:hypothetical protein
VQGRSFECGRRPDRQIDIRTLIYPELKGRLNGHAVRVPLLNASITDCVFEVERPTTVDEVNALFKAAAEGPLAGILGYEERPLVTEFGTPGFRHAPAADRPRCGRAPRPHQHDGHDAGADYVGGVELMTKLRIRASAARSRVSPIYRKISTTEPAYRTSTRVLPNPMLPGPDFCLRIIPRRRTAVISMAIRPVVRSCAVMAS